jgi:hypothetical protein
VRGWEVLSGVLSNQKPRRSGLGGGGHEGLKGRGTRQKSEQGNQVRDGESYARVNQQPAHRMWRPKHPPRASRRYLTIFFVSPLLLLNFFLTRRGGTRREMTRNREVNQSFRLSAMLRRPFSASSHDTTGETDGWRTFLTGSDMESRGLTWEIGMPSHRPFL